MTIHLSELIADEMRTRRWNLDHLVAAMGPFKTPKDWRVTRLSWDMFLNFHSRSVALGDHMAKQLSKAFDVDAQFFINLHEQWRASEDAAGTEIK